MKSFVSIAQNQCIVCGHLFYTGELLLDKRMQNSMEVHTCTGQGLCPEHQELYDQGYVALVEVSNQKDDGSTTLKQEDAVRTGRIIHVRRECLNIRDDMPTAFVDMQVIDLIAEQAGVDPNNQTEKVAV